MCNPIPGPGPATTKVLCLGDSRVLGSPGTPNSVAWRLALWQWALATNRRIELIGTLVSPQGGLTHTKHDGHGGKPIDHPVVGGDNSLRELVEDHYGPGLTITTADLVVIHAGTNDLGFPGRFPYDGVLTPERRYTWLELIHQRLPTARILDPETLPPIDPVALPDNYTNLLDLNSKIPGLHDDFDAAYQDVLIRGCDLWQTHSGAFNQDNFFDTVHENLTGCDLLVNQPTGYAAALAPFIPQLP